MWYTKNMNFIEYLSDYENNLTQGHSNEPVWVCDLRYEDYGNKPIRHVAPTLVIPRDNTELPKSKTVYYSPIHFVKLKANGEPGAQIIAPFDNTGFRGRTGHSVFVFTSKEECENHYETLKVVAVEGLRSHKEFVNKALDAAIQQWL